MEVSRRTVPCNRCRKPVLAASLKYVPLGMDSEIAVCPECYEKVTSHAPERRQQLKQEKKSQYNCKRCNFRFSKPEFVEDPACPFCGKKDRVESYGTDYASKLVHEARY